MGNGYRSVLRRSYALVAVLGLTASPALAQFIPRAVENTPLGENYHVEASAGFWSPGADMSISSESLGIAGTTIDFKKDLGMTDHRFGELHFVLRPTKKAKLRFQYIPLSYTQSATLQRQIVFNGQRYDLGIPVSSSLDWKAYRFTYEYDAYVQDRGFVGLILDAKYTDVTARLTATNPKIEEYAHAKAPIPAIGGIVRIYPVPYISVTGELSGFSLGWLSKSVTKENDGHYTDFDMYGTFNFNRNLAAQMGYRSFDLGYLVSKDAGSFTVKGLYFGAVARY
jgi:hypothetical protein